jgi:hypothetical protein
MESCSGMSNTKGQTTWHWALPPTNNNLAHRPHTGRVIFGMLTGGESPEPNNEVVTSAKDRRR